MNKYKSTPYYTSESQQLEEVDSFTRGNTIQIFVVKKPKSRNFANVRTSSMDFPLKITNYRRTNAQLLPTKKLGIIYPMNQHKLLRRQNNSQYTQKAKLNHCLRILNSEGKDLQLTNVRDKNRSAENKTNKYFVQRMPGRLIKKAIFVKKVKSQVKNQSLYNKRIHNKKQYIYALKSSQCFPHFSIEDVKKRIKRNSLPMIY